MVDFAYTADGDINYNNLNIVYMLPKHQGPHGSNCVSVFNRTLGYFVRNNGH